MKRKLLLADDSVTIQKVVNLTFADEGIDVITVGDGNSAIAKISEISPDVILADVHMPGLSGYQVCEMVRQNEATKGLPVVLLVGSFEPFDENEAARVGANAFLTKPFQSIRQLVSQVSDLIETSAHAGMPASEPPQVASNEYAVETSGYSPEASSGYANETTGDEYPEPADGPEPAAPPKIRDTTDIDSLYAQSVGGGPAAGDSETGSRTYVDAGMDDEMIETVHAGAEEPADEEAAAEDLYQEPTAEYQQPAGEYQLETTGYSVPGSEYEEPVAEGTQRFDEYREPSTEYREPVAEHFEPAAGYNESAVEYHEPAVEFQEHASEHNEPSTQYEQPAESVFQDDTQRPSSPFDSPAEEAHSLQSQALDATNPLGQYSSTQNIPEAATTREFSLDDVNLLELPPIAGGQTVEFTTNPEGGKQVVSLSPELMDALVEKVVKKLSNKE